MHQKLKKLKSSLNEYASMQKTHLDEFKAQKDFDFEKRNYERIKSFEYLKNQFTLIFKDIKNFTDDETKEMAISCNEKLTSIIQNHEILEKFLSEYRTRLEQRIIKLQHGRKAVSGYGQLNSNCSPKVMAKSG